MDYIGVALVGIVLAGLYFCLRPIWVSSERSKVLIEDTHCGVLIRKGVASQILPAGRYSTWLSDDRIDQFDLREQSSTIPGQDLLTGDMLSVKVSMIVRWRIADGMLFRKSTQSGYSRVYEDVQIELRRRVAQRTLDELTKDRGDLTQGFRESIASSLSQCGVEVLAVELRDLSLVGPAKQAFADLWKAQKDGQAALERARGEQASLRALANAARMLKGNPELMNLRLLQALSGAPGKAPPTIVLGCGGGLLPVAGDPDAGVSQAPEDA